MPSPSIVPGTDRDIYLVLDGYGRVGRAWAETGEDHTSLDAVRKVHGVRIIAASRMGIR
jgi:hypothetical protein